MIKDRDFIFTGLQSWDIAIGSNAKDIAAEIAKNNRVLYVNTPLDIKTFYGKEQSPETKQRRSVIRKEKHYLRRIQKNLWVLDLPFTILPVNALPDGCVFDYFNKKNNQKIFGFIKKVLDELGFKDVIHFNDNDPYRSFYAQEYLTPDLSVYYLRDNLSEVDFWKKHILRIEPLLMQKSNLVLCNSKEFLGRIRQQNKHGYYIGQGINMDSYDNPDQLIKPKELADLKHPIVGYIGEITHLRLDYELIHAWVSANPTVTFVFVGREDDLFKKHRLKKLPNFFHFPSQAPEKVPAFIHAFDICINPQLKNNLTEVNYPRKIDEYLALGKIIIATKTSAMDIFDGYYLPGSNLDEYQSALEQIFEKEASIHPEAERIRFAKTHSWNAVVKEMYEILTNLKK